MNEPTFSIDQNTIRQALTRQEFFLEYLPTVCLSDGGLVGAEALIRWRRPEGVLDPAAFLPVAERTPLSGLITYWVIETIASELGLWLWGLPEIHLSLNVPSEILGRGGMEYAANKTGLKRLAPQIVMEVTERGLPDVIGVESLANMWGQQVQVAIDNVTLVDAGHLAIMLRCKFTWLKIDRSLIEQIQPDTPPPPWLEGINALMAVTPLKIVAVGVETEYQATVLRTAGIPYAQGLYFSRPLTAAKLQAFFAGHKLSDSKLARPGLAPSTPA